MKGSRVSQDRIRLIRVAAVTCLVLLLLTAFSVWRLQDPLKDVFFMGSRTDEFRDALKNGDWSWARFTHDRRDKTSRGYIEPIGLVGDDNPAAVRFLVEELGYDPNDQNSGFGSPVIEWLVSDQAGYGVDTKNLVAAIRVWREVGGDPCVPAIAGSAEGMTALEAAIAWSSPEPVIEELTAISQDCDP